MKTRLVTAHVFGTEQQRPSPQYLDTPSPADYNPETDRNRNVPDLKADRFRADQEDAAPHAHIDPYAAQTRRETSEKDNNTAAFKPVKYPSDNHEDTTGDPRLVCRI
eukprot:TRINITY_DN214_c0_g1_i1.p2 TRINITY_DN214_c0_g1~~TRINITY_DN214_c0_g1_i1.p2  ORF type:complete len:107 (+),score=24.19 TRINITY_DN214_c0_g1_i1:80-400(+)